MTDLTGRSALITGASRGLGRHLAHVLAEAGMNLALCARSQNDLRRVSDEAESAGAHVFWSSVDVRDYEKVRAFCSSAVDKLGGLDVLINNAGLSYIKPLDEWSREQIDEVLDVNLKGTVYFCRETAPLMAARGRGHIVNIASDIGRRVIADMAPYVAAKHGVVGFSGSLLREVKDRGVKVTVVLPGIIDTYFGGEEEGSREESWSMPPRDVAEAILHLLRYPPNIVPDELQLHPLGQEL